MPSGPEQENSDEDLWGSFEAAFGNDDGSADDPHQPDTPADALPIPPIVNDTESAARLPEVTTNDDIAGVVAQLQSMFPAAAPENHDLAVAPPVITSDIPVPAPLFTNAPRDAESSGVIIEQKGSAVFKLNHKGVISLRLRTSQAAVRYELIVTSDLFEKAEVFAAECPSPNLYDIGSIRFVPGMAGEEEIRVELTVSDTNQIPLTRVTGHWIVNVESPDSNSITAGGDVIVVGGRPGGLPLAPTSETAPWTVVPVIADAALEARRTRMLPPAEDGRPVNLSVGSPFHGTGALYVGGTNDELLCYAVSIGTSSAIGRGGARDVPWWIRPVPCREDDFSRISRRHVAIEFRGKHCWVIDHSANGTSLNGRPLISNSATVLANDDTIKLAGVLSFRVRLHSDNREVQGIELIREDELSQSMRLLLVKAGSPQPISLAGATFWAAWVENDSVQLKVPGGDWNNACSGEESELESDLVVAWHPFDEPIDQDQLF